MTIPQGIHPDMSQTSNGPAYTPRSQVRNVRMSSALMDLLVELVAARDVVKATLDWGEPDEDGFYTPTLTVTNIAK